MKASLKIIPSGQITKTGSINLRVRSRLMEVIEDQPKRESCDTKFTSMILKEDIEHLTDNLFDLK
jgi:hypothetical protein